MAGYCYTVTTFFENLNFCSSAAHDQLATHQHLSVKKTNYNVANVSHISS